jgi:signal transduction histidine kinase
MERNTNQLLKLTTQLLDFRKIESKVYTINLSEENISCLLQETFESFKLLAETKKLHYCLHNVDTSLYAKVDPEALQKILNNLFSNAIKYAEKTVFVELKHITDKDCLELEIKNDGYIIPGEMQERIFEPFFRIETSTVHQSGTGIGLTLSRSLAELLGGKLYLRNAFDDLNTFVLMLPLR